MRLELGSDTDDDALWSDQMWAGTPPPVHSRGLDALSFTNSAGGEEEHVAYVGANNQLYDWRLVNGGGALWRAIAAPSGETFTGHVALGRRLDRVFVCATTTNGRIYFWEAIDWSAGNFRQHGPVTGVSTTAMISSSGPPAATYLRVFFSKSDNTVWQYKFDGVGWTSVSFAGPDAPAAPDPADRPARLCSLAAATEGQVGNSAGYKTYLFCTRTGGSPHYTTLYYRVATGSGNTNFGAAWSSKTVPTGAVPTTGFSLTTRRRAEGSNYTLEAILLGSTKLLHVEHTANAASLGSITSMGWDGETTARPGGVAAAGDETRGYSDTYFVGQAHNASWLYRRIQDDNGDGVPFEWVNYGPAKGWKTYLAGSNATESSTAILGGRVVFAAMFRDSGEDEGIKILWSADEGDTIVGPTSLTDLPAPYWLSPGPPAPDWRPGFDPVADFDDSGKAYIVELRSAIKGDGTDGGIGIILWSTTNGTPTYELQVFGSVTEKADHAWISVYRNPNGVDELHMAWQIVDGGPLQYTHAPVNNLAALSSNIVDVQSGGITVSFPRITVSRFDGTAYIIWTHGICRVLANGACQGLLAFSDDYTPDKAASDTGHELEFPHTSNSIRAVRCFSAVVDPSAPMTVYYAFQKREPGVPDGEGPMDLYVARLNYAFGAIFPGPRIPLTWSLDDGMHQTQPELAIAEDGPNARMIFASWYDWHNVFCSIGGVDYDGSDWAHSACYEVRMATSSDLGVSWNIIPHGFPTISDPALLPQRRPDHPGVPPTERFLGDYHSVSGDMLHSLHVAITAPVGGGTDEVTNVERGWFSHGYWNNSN